MYHNDVGTGYKIDSRESSYVKKDTTVGLVQLKNKTPMKTNIIKIL